jgi:hypothetical protein
MRTHTAMREQLLNSNRRSLEHDTFDELTAPEHYSQRNLWLEENNKKNRRYELGHHKCKT